MTTPPASRLPSSRRASSRRAGRIGTVGIAGAAAIALLTSACGSLPGTTIDPSPRRVSLTVDGLDRSYLLEPASDARSGRRSALVVVLHQEGGTPEGVAAETELEELRDGGATLVYPSGVDDSWAAGTCCGLPDEQGVDDVSFLDAVISDAARRTPLDLTRTALVGYSSGGMLVYRYLCTGRARLAAAVVVSGSLQSSCRDDLVVPDLLALHGKADGTVGLTTPVYVKALDIAPRPAASTLQILTASAGCAPRPTRRTPTLELRHWDCRGGTTVQARLVPGAGHAWGGLGASGTTRAFLRDRLLAPLGR